MKKYLLLLSLSIATITTDSSAMFNFFKKISQKKAPKRQLFDKKKESYEIDEFYKNQWNKKRPEVVEQIVKAISDKNYNGINTSDYTSSGYTPLCHAIQGNDFEIVKALLNLGVDINQEIKGVHSNKPIFFAKTKEMVEFLHKQGADIYVINKGSGISDGMNLLHDAIGIHCKDNRIFIYALEQGIDPKSLNDNGGNLWDSFLWISARYCPEETLLTRAQLLHDLKLNPYHKNKNGKSAIDYIKNEIESDTKYLTAVDPQYPTVPVAIMLPDFDNRVTVFRKLKRLLNFMEDKTNSQIWQRW